MKKKKEPAATQNASLPVRMVPLSSKATTATQTSGTSPSPSSQKQSTHKSEPPPKGAVNDEVILDLDAEIPRLDSITSVLSPSPSSQKQSTHRSESPLKSAVNDDEVILDLDAEIPRFDSITSVDSPSPSSQKQSTHRSEPPPKGAVDYEVLLDLHAKIPRFDITSVHSSSPPLQKQGTHRSEPPPKGTVNDEVILDLDAEIPRLDSITSVDSPSPSSQKQSTHRSEPPPKGAVDYEVLLDLDAEIPRFDITSVHSSSPPLQKQGTHRSEPPPKGTVNDEVILDLDAEIPRLDSITSVDSPSPSSQKQDTQRSKHHDFNDVAMLNLGGDSPELDVLTPVSLMSRSLLEEVLETSVSPLSDQLAQSTDNLELVVPNQEDLNRYNNSQNWSQFIRYTFRDPFINRAQMIPYAICCTSRNNFHRLWLEGRAVELPSRDLKFQRNAEYYLSGKDTFMKTLWPLALLGMMIYDGIQLARFPALSFDNTSLDIFGGFSPNSLSIATNMGSDIAAEFSYWFGFAVLVAGPVVFGLSNIALHWRWARPMEGIDPRDHARVTRVPRGNNFNLNDFKDYFASFQRVGKGAIFDEYQTLFLTDPAPNHLNWLNPLSQRRRLLDLAVFALLYHPDMDQELIRKKSGKWNHYHPGLDLQYYDNTTRMSKERLLLGCITRLASLPPSLAQQCAYQALAKIVDKLKQSDFIRKVRSAPLFDSASASIGSSSNSAADESRALIPDVSNQGTAAKMAVRQSAFFTLLTAGVGVDENYGSQLRAKYQLWTTGFKDFSWKLILLFAGYAGIKNLWLIYAYYRYYLFIIRKIVGGIQFLVTKSDCEKQDKLFLYNPDIGNYDCSICGDWPTVFDTYTSQGCLSGVLESSNNPEVINKALLRVKPFTSNLTKVSLFGQNWIIWSEQQFGDFVGNLTPMTAIGSFNASRVDYNIAFPQNTNKIVALAKLNQGSCVASWDFTNQRIGDAITPFTSSLFNNHCTRELVLTGSALADQNMRNLADIFNSTQIDHLVLDHNNLSGNVLDYFAEQDSVSLLKHLSVQTNFLGQTGLNALAKLITRNPLLRHLYAGNNDFSGLDFTAFGTGLQRVQIQHLGLNGCSLGDDEIAELAPYLNTTQSVNLADNNGLSRQGAEVLMASLQGAVTTELSLRGIPMDSSTAQALGDGLSATNIEALDISDSEIKGEDFVTFLSKLKGSKVRSLKASENLFGSDICHHIAQVISQQGLIFSEIDFSSNNMGDEAGAHLVEVLTANSTNIKLRLNNNSLGSQTASVLQQKIQEGRIIALDVDSNQFSSKDLNAIVTALPNSSLQSFSYRDNGQALDGTVESTIATQLLKDLPDAGDIVNDPPSRDLARWIHSKGQPQTAITNLNSQDNNVALPGARALCNVMKPARLTPKDVRVSTHGVNPTANPCFFNRNGSISGQLQLPAVRNAESNTSQQGSMMFLALGIPVIGLIFIAVLLYKWMNTPRVEKDDERNNFQP